MRLIGAGLFVFGGLLALVAGIGCLNGFARAPAWLIGAGLSICMLVLIVVALLLFNRRGAAQFGRQSAEERLRELEQLGLLDAKEFRAKRAFGVSESEDEGLHYYLELTDGRVLFLSGQYLYDYEPIADDPEANQPRMFPCSEFTVRRHKGEGYVVDILCRGAVLEPELIAPPFGGSDWREDRVPEDGAVISGTPYDDLKRARAG